MDASTEQATDALPAVRPVYARVVLPLPLEKAFHYRIPPSLEDQVRIGSRVRVRFRGRRRVGTVVGIDPVPEVAAVLDVEECLADECRIPEEMLDLCRRVGERFAASLGETLEAALPPPLRSGRARRRIPFVRLRKEEEKTKEQILELLPRRPQQSRALRLLLEARGTMRELDLRRLAKVGPSPVRSLIRSGLIERLLIEALDDPLLHAPADSKAEPQLTDAQRIAVERIFEPLRALEHRAFLLLGVTGSGKTEVYLRALRECVAQGRQGIVLVPEISLTPQTVARFRARFPRIAVLHSALTESQRLDQWRRIRSDEIDVVIGARSAVFAPTRRPGLIVVDEEHEPSFKQQNPPRYHAREVALERARRAGAIVVLGSATPSLETFAAAGAGRLSLLELKSRVGGGVLPTALVVDLGYLPFTQGAKAHLITVRMREAIARTLARKEQVILFLNRRGYSRMVLCMECRSPVRCKRCDTSLVMHRAAHRMICHLCGHEQLPVSACLQCGRPSVRALGFGTERIEEELRKDFRGATVARMDSDTTTQRGAHERILGAFASGKVDILVGTQMIAKGLDFPRVSLVGIVSADTSLAVPDYRASERTFQLVAQVAGRAGRAQEGGQVIVQTLFPDHPAIVYAVRHDYQSFAAYELESRRRACYPPFAELARILFSHPDEARVRKVAAKVAQHLLPRATRAAVQMLGPSPCPVTRVRGRYRHQILLKCPDEATLIGLLKDERETLVKERPVRVTVDVDPSTML